MRAETSARKPWRPYGARRSRQTGKLAPEQTVGHLTRLVQVRLYQLYYERLAHLGVSPGAFGVLATVWTRPGIQHGELAHVLAIRGPNLTKLVNQLVREGLLERRNVKNDGRTAGHYLSERAAMKVQHILAEGIAHDANVTLTALRANERQRLLNLLTKLANGLADLTSSNSAGAFKKRTRTKRSS